MKRALGIVADDFTGALMVAGYLEGAGLHCPVVFAPDAEIPSSPLVIAGTRTRTVPVADAIEELGRMADALLRAGCERLAYKACATFDSTAEGNIGPAADYLADLMGARPVLMSAGFPRLGTTVHQGYLFYRGRLVSESIKRFDPLTPMSDPDLVRFLGQQTPHRFALVNHATLQRGTEAARLEVERLAGEGAGHVLFDATDQNDVETSADVAAAMTGVVAASDPLIIAYATRLARMMQAEPVAPPRHVEGPAAVIAGSVGPVVLAQLAAFSARHPLLTLDLLGEAGEEGEIARAVEWAKEQRGREPFAISTAVDQAGVDRAQAALGPIGAARRAERILGAVARELRDQAGIRRFVVAGGETSGAVVTALDITSVRALPEGRLGTGFCVAPGPVPVSLYLKPGKLGADDVLLQAIEAMDE
ncbi:MAG: four-carbon acid sugar kinase family protein [Methylobacterium mesophilicum]|nr:four-carbon acid sugar kinase family protein [Methylobacterium mesophilicum]